MVVIVFFVCMAVFFSVDGCEGFSCDQRDEAQVFISTCFDRLELIQQGKTRILRDNMRRADEIIDYITSRDQINYQMFNTYDAQREAYEEDLHVQRAYATSLLRSKESIATWEGDCELQARALQAYMSISDEWELYKKDPLNIEVYEQLHKRMLSMARMLVRAEHGSEFVSGTHARSSDPDKLVNYDVDRVFFLAMYLLNKELQAEKVP